MLGAGRILFQTLGSVTLTRLRQRSHPLGPLLGRHRANLRTALGPQRRDPGLVLLAGFAGPSATLGAGEVWIAEGPPLHPSLGRARERRLANAGRISRTKNPRLRCAGVRWSRARGERNPGGHGPSRLTRKRRAAYPVRAPRRRIRHGRLDLLASPGRRPRGNARRSGGLTPERCR